MLHGRWIIGLTALLAMACGADPKSAPGEAAPVTSAAKSQAGKAPIPIEKLIEQVTRELHDMGEVWKLDYDTGRLLGRINGNFQEQGYFSRIPSGPATGGVESNIRALASYHALVVENFEARVPEQGAAPERKVLQPGERWQPTEEELFATIPLKIDLQGPVESAAKLIDDMPRRLERLVVVTGDQARAGGVTLHAECWFERALPMPKIDLPWPELEERLEAAGWDPDDEAVQRDPQVQQLREMVETGRQRMVDVRNTLAVASDFPRWLLRNKFLEKKSLAAQSVKGSELLSTIAGK